MLAGEQDFGLGDDLVSFFSGFVGPEAFAQSSDFNDFDGFGADALNDIWGSMYDRNAHDGPGGFYAPGGIFYEAAQMVEAMLARI